MNEKKEMVKDLLKSIETGDSKPVGYINPKKYIQHNLEIEDGLQGFGKVLSQLPKGSAKVNTVRLLADGDFVAAHTDYNFFGPKVGFDIFRFENGKIVEHWDNLSEKADSPNPSGRNQLDGPTQVTDLEKTEANKKLVEEFVNTVLLRQEYDKAARYIDPDNYRQHNTQMSDNLSGLQAAMGALAKQGITMVYDKVHKIIGEGNFVLVSTEGRFGGKPTAYYDLFRVADGKIVEHWDVIETVPSKDQWKNRNGKF
jgi:predicted SnoaL-like aldol condensation-catalyzing enzyme